MNAICLLTLLLSGFTSTTALVLAESSPAIAGSSESVVVMAAVSGLVTSVLGVITLIINRHYQIKEKEQARLDRLADAEITRQSRQKVLAAAEGAQKEARGAKNVASIGVRKAVEAIETSNGIKRDLMTNGVRLVQDSPLKVEVENSPGHPVSVQIDTTD